MSQWVFTEVLGSSTFTQLVVIGLLLDIKNSFLASHLRGILNVSLGATSRKGGSNSS